MTITQTATLELDSPESFGLALERAAAPEAGAYVHDFHSLPPELREVIARELRTALTTW